jgi:Transglycosylase-like domain
MRKTGLCGVVIATLFAAAGLLQHPNHQSNQHKTTRVSTSPLAQAGINLLNSNADFGHSSRSATNLPNGFLRVVETPGPTPAQLAAYRRQMQVRRFEEYEQAVAGQRAVQAAELQQQEEQEQEEAQQQAQEQQAQAEAAAQAQAQAQAQAAARAQAQAQAEAQAQAQAQSSASGGVWAELRECESGGDYSADTGNGYYGAYQFSLSTWESLGYSGLPSSAPPSVQDQAAQTLQAEYGWGQWPVCSAELGLT